MNKSTLYVLLMGCLVVALAVGGYFAGWYGQLGAADPKPGATTSAVANRIDVIKPKRRTSVQPAQVEPFERVEIIPKINGYLKAYDKDLAGKEIDTGGRVRAGQVLLTLSIPELEKELQLKKASVQEASKAIQAAQDRLKAVEKDRDKYEAEMKYRDSELVRYDGLFKRNSIEKSLLDEKRSQAEAAKAAFESADAKIKQAKADIEVAQARLAVAEFDVQRVTDLVGYITLSAPATEKDALYVVSRRWADPGAYLQPGTGMQRDAVLSLMRIDKVRV